MEVIRPEEDVCLFMEDHVKTLGHIFIIAESFRSSYGAIRPMLTSLAEPASRPMLMHSYKLTPFSLGTAVSNGVTAEEAISFFERYTYGLSTSNDYSNSHYHYQYYNMELHETVRSFVTTCMRRYNQVRIVIENERTLVQCRDEMIADMLLSDAVIASGAVQPLTLEHAMFSWNDTLASYPFFLLQNRNMAKVVAARCVLLGLPIQQQYDYEHDPSTRTAFFSLRSQTRPRSYQVEAVEAATKEGTLNSGCLLLPCGAGKTLVGIMLMCKVRKPTLVVCAGAVSVEQWRNQILEAASLDPLPTEEEEELEQYEQQQQQEQQQANSTNNNTKLIEAHTNPRRSRMLPRRVHKTGPARLSGAARIACLTGKQKDNITEDTDVVLTTYSMLVSAYKSVMRKRAQHNTSYYNNNNNNRNNNMQNEPSQRRRKSNVKDKLFAPYGLLILDEVHVIPAEAFRESLGYIDAKGVIGLTATYVREDNKILDLFHLVGPKLYDISMETLVAQGYLAKVNCVEVHTPMTREFGIEYMERCNNNNSNNNVTTIRNNNKESVSNANVPALILLAAANPYKIQCVQELVARHLESGAKILVFCDHLLLLHEYAKILNVPVISGATPHRERLMIFSDFQSTPKINVICISRVGDVSVNLPSANVVIQVSSHGGSRRQEAQRLGRILRPKERAANGVMVEAWFYSVISMDTLEMAHAAHRTAFLVDQGYTCRLMEFVPEYSECNNIKCTNHDKRGIKADDEQKKEETVKMEPSHVKMQPVKEEAVRVKQDVHQVGDAVSIKQENIYHTLHSAHAIRRHDNHTAASGKEHVRSLEYQLMLLSRVVASWEISFQQSSRLRETKSLSDNAVGKSSNYNNNNSNSNKREPREKEKKKSQNKNAVKRKRADSDAEEDNEIADEGEDDEEELQMYASESDSEDNTTNRHYDNNNKSNDVRGDNDDDDDVTEIIPHRGLQVIKREFTDDVQEGVLQRVVALNTLVGVEDGFVYHEL